MSDPLDTLATGETRAAKPGGIMLPSVGILGAGSMGQALLAGITKPTVFVQGPIHATCRSADRLADLRQFPTIVAASVDEDPEANRRAASVSDLLVLAVSPDQLPALVDDISSSLRPGTLLVSLAAGVTLSRLRGMIPETCTVVRAIPNVGGKVGLGVTGVGTKDLVPGAVFETLRDLFSTVGIVLNVRDDQLDAVSSLSGSGPAYFYYFVEQMAAAGVELGFSQEQAQELAEQTFMGAAALMQASGEGPGKLLGEFTAPTGTTVRALNVMSAGRLKELLVEAASASIARAQEIAAETAK